jgi:hypothetical protein
MSSLTSSWRVVAGKITSSRLLRKDMVSAFFETARRAAEYRALCIFGVAVRLLMAVTVSAEMSASAWNPREASNSVKAIGRETQKLGNRIP